MKLFIDTGSVAEVEQVAAWGILAGATTNPSLLAKEEGDPGEAIKRICELVDGPTSAEVVSDNAQEMVREGRALGARALDDGRHARADGLGLLGVPLHVHLEGR